MAAKKKAIDVKLDDVLRAQVLSKCQSKGCKTTSNYLKALILQDVFQADSSQLQANAADAASSPETPKLSTADIEAAIEKVLEKRQAPLEETNPLIPSYIPAFR